MKAIRHSLILISMISFLSSCDGVNWDNPCEDCYQEKPTQGILTIIVDSDYLPAVPIKLYKGKLEKGRLFLVDTLNEISTDVWVNVGSFYTVVVEYKKGEKTILAVDGDKVTVFFDEESCDVPCWRPHDGKVDCTLVTRN